MSNSDPLLNVREILSLADGTYIEPGFVCVVGKITPAKGKAPMRAILMDVEQLDPITAVLWSRPRIAEGQTVEFTGRGILMKEYRNQPEISISDKADIRVVGGGIPRNAVGGSRNSARQDEPERAVPARGTQADFSTDPDPRTIAENNARNFHKGMARQCLLLAHCWIYSRRLFQKLQSEAGFQFDQSQEESWIRATVHGLHIEANRQGLDAIVVNLDVQAPGTPAAPKEPAPPSTPRERPPAPPEQGGRDDSRARFRDDPHDDIHF